MRQINLWAVISLLLFTSGCAKLFGGLRQDLNDGSQEQSTTGGVWPERQLTDDSDLQKESAYSDYKYVGHSERDPASTYQPSDPSQSWMAQQNDGYHIGDDPERDRAIAEQQMRAAQAQKNYKNGSRATRSDFVDDSQNEGSLWASSGQTNYFFTKNSIKSPGDILTVTAGDQFIKDIAAEVKRTLSDDERDAEVDTLTQKRQRAIASVGDTKTDSAAAAPGTTPAAAAPVAEPKTAEDVTDPSKTTFADVDLTKSLGLKAGDTMMAEVVERYPSGNYKIRGTKRINYKGGQRLLTFVGIARSSDITETDTLDSGKLYEYRLHAEP